VRVAALDAIARLAAAGNLDPGRVILTERAVAAVLRQDPDPLVRARAATALASFGTSSAGAAAADVLVVAFQRDGDVRVRRNAMWAIFRSYAIRVPRAVLTSGLHDSDEIVRIEAVRAYGRLKNADAVAALRPLLNDPSWRVAEQTAESIRALQGKPPTDHWSAIPANVQLPPIPPDALASLPALPRNAPAAKPVAPVPSQAILQPQIDPRTAADMNGPAPGSHPRVRIVTTKGNVYVTLFPEWAPMTVANFLNVADHGYYDNNRWFRIVPDFVVQTGDPNDNGEGDAGFSLGAEENPLEQQSYVISMGLNYDGNAPIRDSAGTQFYITLSPQLHLNRDFTVFGAVSGGEAVLAHLVESDRIVRVERIADVTL
jgi:peptidyl-prolyl cis-trans isomerase B (cyclophilin B)